jgi:hypothetical protein
MIMNTVGHLSANVQSDQPVDGDWKAKLKAPTKDARPQTEVRKALAKR